MTLSAETKVRCLVEGPQYANYLLQLRKPWIDTDPRLFLIPSKVSTLAYWATKAGLMHLH
jgi:hypothetical protein